MVGYIEGCRYIEGFRCIGLCTYIEVDAFQQGTNYDVISYGTNALRT